jgi:hypothetical protein
MGLVMSAWRKRVATQQSLRPQYASAQTTVLFYGLKEILGTERAQSATMRIIGEAARWYHLIRATRTRLMALYGQLVSALLPPGFQDQPAFFGPHPTTESVFAFADDLGWRL